VLRPERPAILGGRIWLPHDCGVDLAAVRRAATVRNPAADGRFNKGADPWLRFYEDLPGGVLVPRHFHWFIRGTHPAIEDARTAGRRVRLIRRCTLRKPQEEASMALSVGGGMLVSPGGSGKTVVLLDVIARIERLALVIVDRKPLVTQWIDRAGEHYGVAPEKVGVIGDGRNDWRGKDLIVGLRQTLCKGADPGLLEEVGIVAVDECHHIPAITALQALQQFPAVWRIGATATPVRSDGLDFVFDWALGSRRHVMPGHNVAPTVYVYETGARVDRQKVTQRGRFRSGQRRPVNIPKVATYLAGDHARTGVIAHEIIRAVEEGGRRVLVLTDRVVHAVEIGSTVGGRVEGTVICVGQASRSVRTLAEACGVPVYDSRDDGREEAMARGRVVVATASLAKEGLDVQALDTLFDVGIYSDATRALQSAYRVARICDGKKDPIVVVAEDDFVTAKRLVQSRVRAYRKEGYEIVYGLPNYGR